MISKGVINVSKASLSQNVATAMRRGDLILRIGAARGLGQLTDHRACGRRSSPAKVFASGSAHGERRQLDEALDEPMGNHNGMIRALRGSVELAD
jgi:hypothetical protein